VKEEELEKPRVKEERKEEAGMQEEREREMQMQREREIQREGALDGIYPETLSLSLRWETVQAYHILALFMHLFVARVVSCSVERGVPHRRLTQTP
jgi:hypothetical protein